MEYRFNRFFAGQNKVSKSFKSLFSIGRFNGGTQLINDFQWSPVQITELDFSLLKNSLQIL